MTLWNKLHCICYTISNLIAKKSISLTTYRQISITFYIHKILNIIRKYLKYFNDLIFICIYLDLRS